MPKPEWLGAATDRLKEVGLDEAAEWMERKAREEAAYEESIAKLRLRISDAINVAVVTEGRSYWGPRILGQGPLPPSTPDV